MGRAVILAAEGIVYQTICTRLNNLREEIYHGTVYECGVFPVGEFSWEVCLFEIVQGGITASIETERAISYFKPDVILYISLVTGIQHIHLGDVVSATKVYAYESGRSSATIEARPVVWNVSYAMEQRARAEVRKKDWLKRVEDQSDHSSAKVVLAPIAAGEKVIASTQSSLYPFLQSHYNDAVAVDVGGHGVLGAVHAHRSINALVVCGIAELIQNDLKNEREEHALQQQRIAAQHASAFAFEVLAKLQPVHPSAQSSEETMNMKSRKDREDASYSYVLSNAGPANTKGTPFEIFYSYATEDKQSVGHLQTHLAVLEQAGRIVHWDREKIPTGAEVSEHRRHLDSAPVIVILISPYYIRSRYYKEEAPRALERRTHGNVRVIPILLRPTDGWQEYTDFGPLRVLPREDKTIADFANRDQAWSDVAKEIRAVVEDLKNGK